jgi:ABC-2 type transport system ATP-binding protein
LRDLLRGQARDGRAILVSSHVLSEVAQTVDQVVIIDRGRLVSFSPLTDLTARLTGDVRVRAPEAARLQRELEREGIHSALLDGDELRVQGAASARVGEIAYHADLLLHALVPESSSLEDVFLELTAKERS